MKTTPENADRRRWPIALVAGGLLIGGGAVGAIGVGAANASQTLASAPNTSASSSTGTSKHGSETAVTGAKATTLKAAALKAVPGATVLRVETDSDGAAYEVHLKKTDGTHVTVKFDSALKQTAIETGTGHGGGHHHGGDRPSSAE